GRTRSRSHRARAAPPSIASSSRTTARSCRPTERLRRLALGGRVAAGIGGRFALAAGLVAVGLPRLELVDVERETNEQLARVLVVGRLAGVPRQAFEPG